MAKTLVTGGAGFIGSHLVDALLERGDSVRVLDDFSTGRESNLAGVLGGIELMRGDLRDADLLRGAVGGIETVFHQAAFVSVPGSLADPQACFETNAAGTSRLLSAAREAGVRRVVLASSAAVYGDNPALPLSEDALPAPLSPYAASKQMGEILARLYSTSLGLEVTALRYFNVYGPRQNPASDYAAVIPIFIKTLQDEGEPVIYGDGRQGRDFVYVRDVVRANLLAAASSAAPGRILNICTGQEISLLGLLELLGGFFNREIKPSYQPPRPGDIYRSLGDPSRSSQVLGFQPLTSLEEGLRATADWMQGI